VDDECRHIVESFWRAMNDNDFQGAGGLLADDFVLDYPQSRERLRGRENWVALNQEYPAAGRWSFQVHRLIVENQQAVTEVTVSDTLNQFMLVSFFQARDGRIQRMIEYWPDPFDPPGMRAHLVEMPGGVK
jgi:limonene-1,2-epoxide hydrolase